MNKFPGYITKEEVDIRREAVIRNNPFNWRNGFCPIYWNWSYRGLMQVEKRMKTHYKESSCVCNTEMEAIANNFFVCVCVAKDGSVYTDSPIKTNELPISQFTGAPHAVLVDKK